MYVFVYVCKCVFSMYVGLCMYICIHECRGGSTSGLQWDLPPPPKFNGLLPPPIVLPQFLFAEALLPKYNEDKGVDG